MDWTCRSHSAEIHTALTHLYYFKSICFDWLNRIHPIDDNEYSYAGFEGHFSIQNPTSLSKKNSFNIIILNNSF